MNKAISRKGILYNQYFLILVLFILYRPEFVLQFSTLDTIINMLRVFFTIIIFGIYIFRNRITKTMLWVVAIWGGFNILCLMNKTWNFEVLIEFAIILTITILVEIYYDLHIKLMSIAVHKLLAIFAIGNTITIFAGYDVENLFLGFDNDAAMRIIPLIGVMFFLSIKTYENLRKEDWIIYSIYLFDFIYTWSISSVIGLVVMGVLIRFRGRWKKIITSGKAIATTIVAWIFLYVFKIQYIISVFFVYILKKDITLSYRIYIWKSVINAIRQSPIWGYGNIMNNDTYYSLVHSMYYASVAPHNFWLYLCSSAGIIGCIIFILFILRCFKTADKERNTFSNYVLITAFFAYLIPGLFASYYAIEYLVFLLIIANKVNNDLNIRDRKK